LDYRRNAKRQTPTPNAHAKSHNHALFFIIKTILKMPKVRKRCEICEEPILKKDLSKHLKGHDIKKWDKSYNRKKLRMFKIQ
jgi:hypothetical protein